MWVINDASWLEIMDVGCPGGAKSARNALKANMHLKVSPDDGRREYGNTSLVPFPNLYSNRSNVGINFTGPIKVLKVYDAECTRGTKCTN